MDDQVQILLLGMLVLINLAVLIAIVALWRKDNELANRVTALEAQRLTTEQVIGIHSRLASLEDRLVTHLQLLKTVQDHLLENDK